MDVLRWEDNSLLLLDQTRLPDEVAYRTCRHYREVAEAIARLQVRERRRSGLRLLLGISWRPSIINPVSRTWSATWTRPPGSCC